MGSVLPSGRLREDVILHREPSIGQHNSENYKEVDIGDDSILRKPKQDSEQRFPIPKLPSLSHLNLVEILASSENSLSSSSSKSSNVSFNPYPDENIRNGLKRSTAFHTAEFLEDQVREDDEPQTQMREVEETRTNDIHSKYEAALQTVKDEHKLALENAMISHDLKLKQEMSRQKKENDKILRKVEHEANESIANLNHIIMFEREQRIVEQQEKSQQLENIYELKFKSLNTSWKQTEEREQAWQDERADVLKEVQRLKAEATKMAKILAMEYEEDNMSEDKKISLSQEVYSLQLVVEMRTGEVRNLRDQLARATQQLEHA